MEQKLTSQMAATYYGAKVKTHQGIGLMECIADGELLWVDVPDVMQKVFTTGKCQLVLKELSDITDEDAFKVVFYLMAEEDKTIEVLNNVKYKNCHTIEYRYIDGISELNNDDGYSYTSISVDFDPFHLKPAQLDLLRELGYDCGFKKIKSLIQSGIAIKKQ